MEEVRAGAFRVLLRYLYTGEVPEEEDCGEGLEAGEMARVADRFQARGLYEHCVGQFRGGLRVGNVVGRLVAGRERKLGDLEGAAMEFLRANVVAFQVRLSSVYALFVLLLLSTLLLVFLLRAAFVCGLPYHHATVCACVFRCGQWLRC